MYTIGSSTWDRVGGPSWPDSLDGLIEIDGSCDLVSWGVSRANKPSNVYNVGGGGLEGEKGRWQAGNQEGRQAADGGGVGVGSRLSLALTVCQSISSRGVEISAIDNRMNINLINNARLSVSWVGFVRLPPECCRSFSIIGARRDWKSSRKDGKCSLSRRSFGQRVNTFERRVRWIKEERLLSIRIIRE